MGLRAAMNILDLYGNRAIPFVRIAWIGFTIVRDDVVSLLAFEHGESRREVLAYGVRQ